MRLQCGRPGFNPWARKIPWRREQLPTPVFWPGELHGLYNPWGYKEADTTEWLSLWFFYFFLLFPEVLFSIFTFHWSIKCIQKVPIHTYTAHWISETEYACVTSTNQGNTLEGPWAPFLVTILLKIIFISTSKAQVHFPVVLYVNESPRLWCFQSIVVF